MRILYVSQYYPPEMGAPAARVSELSRHWVKAGHQVTVLTGFPNHPTGIVHRGYRRRLMRLVSREDDAGVRIVRTWLIPRPNRGSLDRILNYASFWISSSCTGMFLSRPDVVVATSPQLLVGLTGWWIAKVKRVPFIFEVRDLWPESLAASGVGTDRSLVTRVLGAVSKFLYEHSDHIVVVSPAFIEQMSSRWGVDADKVATVENGVDPELFHDGGAPPASSREAMEPGHFVVSYVGTLGLAHGLTTVLEAAADLQQEHPEVVFQFVGAGAEREELGSAATKLSLRNVRFVPEQPRELIPGIIRGSDVCLVTLKKADIFKSVIPTKMIEFMSCGRPVILGVDGQARQILEEAEAGIFVEPEDSRSLAKAVVRLYLDRELRMRMGENGRRFVVERMSRAETAKRYVTVIDNVVNRRKPPSTSE